jgi:hypothetical protein
MVILCSPVAMLPSLLQFPKGRSFPPSGLLPMPLLKEFYRVSKSRNSHNREMNWYITVESYIRQLYTISTGETTLFSHNTRKHGNSINVLDFLSPWCKRVDHFSKVIQSTS